MPNALDTARPQADSAGMTAWAAVPALLGVGDHCHWQSVGYSLRLPPLGNSAAAIFKTGQSTGRPQAWAAVLALL